MKEPTPGSIQFFDLFSSHSQPCLFSFHCFPCAAISHPLDPSSVTLPSFQTSRHLSSVHFFPDILFKVCQGLLFVNFLLQSYRTMTFPFTWFTNYLRKNSPKLFCFLISIFIKIFDVFRQYQLTIFRMFFFGKNNPTLRPSSAIILRLKFFSGQNGSQDFRCFSCPFKTRISPDRDCAYIDKFYTSSDLLPNVSIGINLCQCVQRLRLLDLTLVKVFRLQDPT